MLISMGVDEEDPDIVHLDDDEISAGDIETAFLVAPDYEPGATPRFDTVGRKNGGEPVKPFGN